MIDLAPCPFCKSPAEMQFLEASWYGDIATAYVQCTGDGCHATGPEVFSDEDEAAKLKAAHRWNDRA